MPMIRKASGEEISLDANLIARAAASSHKQPTSESKRRGWHSFCEGYSPEIIKRATCIENGRSRSCLTSSAGTLN